MFNLLSSCMMANDQSEDVLSTILSFCHDSHVISQPKPSGYFSGCACGVYAENYKQRDKSIYWIERLMMFVPTKEWMELLLNWLVLKISPDRFSSKQVGTNWAIHPTVMVESNRFIWPWTRNGHSYEIISIDLWHLNHTVVISYGIESIF
jgi:hypothetical protein